MKKIIHTDKAPKALGPYSQAVEANGILYISGQVPIDPVINKVVEGGITEQTIQVMKNIEAILEEVSKDPLGLPININGLAGLIASHIQALSGSYKNMAVRMARIPESAQ